MGRSLGLFDEVLDSSAEPLDRVLKLTGGTGVEAAVDCSGHPRPRSLALKALRVRGRLALVGEGGRMTLDVSDDVLHKQVLISGSWVTSVQGMTRLAELLARQGLHPERLVSDRFPLAEAQRAYEAAGRAAGKGLPRLRGLTARAAASLFPHGPGGSGSTAAARAPFFPRGAPP
ncbi:zinc-binding dehydrogenase [Streptomyces sp. SS52]|uniref:zinc-binding dehydrogenase n=1 Tax=Streptomyces sp. SS52 TaxID=2563602 RepID=UPI001FF90471|nr:zinc-binding dehydrogenase [Streptomyces sp. SS52]